MDLRDIFDKTKNAVAIAAVIAVPVSFLSGAFTDSQAIPNLLKNGAGVVIDVPNNVGIWVRRTAVPFVIGLGN